MNVSKLWTMTILIFTVFLLATGYNLLKSSNPGENDSPPDATFKVQIVLKNNTQPLNGLDPNGYQATAILRYNSSKSINTLDLNNTMYVQYDEIVKKSITLKTSKNLTSPIIIGSLSITSKEIQNWTKASGAHTLTFVVDTGMINTTFTDNSRLKEKLTGDSESLQLTVKIPNIYTISIEGSNYIAKDVTETLVASSNDFGTTFNALDSIITTGSTVVIKSGTYLAYTGARLTASNVTVTGQTDTIIRSASTTSPRNFLFRIQGNYEKVIGITFDAHKNAYISPSVYISGSYNTISNCKCINALQYNLEAFNADHFQILNNFCTNSQYGIATMGFYSWCTEGVISGNTITDCQSAGIKIRCCTNTIIENNTIDCAYVQYTERYTYPSKEGMSGLYLAVGDGPSVNITFQNNKIIDSKQEKITRGVFMDEESNAYWLNLTKIRTSNILFKKNEINGLTYPIVTTGSFTKLEGNKIIPR
jgi:parallel beta-helix repeat protein